MNKRLTFAAIGDICVDIYPQYNKITLGGTAFNTAIQATKTGVLSSIFSAIGTDAYADLFKKALLKHNVDSSHLKIVPGKTSQIAVTVENQDERFFSDWHLETLKKYHLDPEDIRALQTYDVAKIMLFKPLQVLFKHFCETSLPNTLKVADFAGSSSYSEGIMVIKKYIDQLDIVIKSLEAVDTASIQFLKQLTTHHKDKLILVLLGGSGSIAFLNGDTYTQPASNVQANDTNGAGDAYITHFLITYLQTQDIKKAMKQGTNAATATLKHRGSLLL